MHLLKPEWVSHDEKPIFSIDIHPNGERFATGGQGADSGRVVVWNMAPVINEMSENDPNVPKMLCQMDNHLACVNVVRWNTTGTLLASGGDDKLVMVWKLAGEGCASMVFGGGGKINVEQWRCVATLRGHAGDVLDLAWAPHGDRLASCSVDNTVIVWNSQQFPDIITVLKGHSGLVKGVAWDPVGKYLASQSDDRSLRVWRTGQWTQEVVVTNPFEECSGTTHVLRLSWSPDGQYLVSAHAMNGGGPTAQIIERDGWKQDKDFVGHRKAITCVRFNSNIFQRIYPSVSKTRYCCCAIGSRDRSLSVWLTSLKRPLFVIQELFESSVLDLTWSVSGLILMACSWDGTVACIQFDNEELGKRLPSSEKDTLYERLYGNTWNANIHSSHTIIENPEVLTMKERHEKSQLKTTASKNLVKRVEGSEEKPQMLTTQEPAKPVNKQIETRLPDGKRRITPMFLVAPPTPTKDVISEKSNSNITETSQTNTFCSSSPTKSKIVIETIAQKPAPAIEKDWKHRVLGPKINPVVACSQTSEIRVPLVSKIENVTTVRYSIQNFTLCATNDHVKTVYGPLSRLQMFKNETPDSTVWETYFGSKVLCISSTQKICCICCEDSNLFVLDVNSGSRLLPPFALSSPAIFIALTENGRCCILTKSNVMHIWDLLPYSQAKVVERDAALPPNSVPCSCTFTESGEPVLMLIDGRTFSYKINLKCWMLLADPRDPLNRMIIGGPIASSKFPLASAQKACGSTSRPIGPPAATLAHLESQIAASFTLNSATEYKHWLLAAIMHLLENGPEWKLRSILDELLGPLKPSQSWETEIMGMKKHDLLNEALTLFGSQIRWQRLYMEYLEQLPR